MNSRLFLFLSFSLLSFFRGTDSPNIDFNKEISSLKKIKKDLNAAVDKFEKIYSVLKKLEESRILKIGDPNIKELSLLLLDIRNICDNRNRLNTLVVLEKKLKISLQEKFSQKSKKQLEFYRIEFNKIEINEEERWTYFISNTFEICEDHINAGSSKALNFLGYGNDISLAEEYYKIDADTDTVKTNSSSNKTKITIKERLHLWKTIKKEEAEWNYIRDTLNSFFSKHRNTHFNELKFSEQFTKICSKNSLLEILNKKYYLEYIHTLISDEEIAFKNELEMFISMYKAKYHVMKDSIKNSSKSNAKHSPNKHTIEPGEKLPIESYNEEEILKKLKANSYKELTRVLKGGKLCIYQEKEDSETTDQKDDNKQDNNNNKSIRIFRTFIKEIVDEDNELIYIKELFELDSEGQYISTDFFEQIFKYYQHLLKEEEDSRREFECYKQKLRETERIIESLEKKIEENLWRFNLKLENTAQQVEQLNINKPQLEIGKFTAVEGKVVLKSKRIESCSGNNETEFAIFRNTTNIQKKESRGEYKDTDADNSNIKNEQELKVSIKEGKQKTDNNNKKIIYNTNKQNSSKITVELYRVDNEEKEIAGTRKELDLNTLISEEELMSAKDSGKARLSSRSFVISISFKNGVGKFIDRLLEEDKVKIVEKSGDNRKKTANNKENPTNDEKLYKVEIWIRAQEEAIKFSNIKLRFFYDIDEDIYKVETGMITQELAIKKSKINLQLSDRNISERKKTIETYRNKTLGTEYKGGKVEDRKSEKIPKEKDTCKKNIYDNYIKLGGVIAIEKKTKYGNLAVAMKKNSTHGVDLSVLGFGTTTNEFMCPEKHGLILSNASNSKKVQKSRTAKNLFIEACKREYMRRNAINPENYNEKSNQSDLDFSTVETCKKLNISTNELTTEQQKDIEQPQEEKFQNEDRAIRNKKANNCLEWNKILKKATDLYEKDQNETLQTNSKEIIENIDKDIINLQNIEIELQNCSNRMEELGTGLINLFKYMNEPLKKMENQPPSEIRNDIYTRRANINQTVYNKVTVLKDLADMFVQIGSGIRQQYLTLNHSSESDDSHVNILEKNNNYHSSEYNSKIDDKDNIFYQIGLATHEEHPLKPSNTIFQTISKLLCLPFYTLGVDSYFSIIYNWCGQLPYIVIIIKSTLSYTGLSIVFIYLYDLCITFKKERRKNKRKKVSFLIILRKSLYKTYSRSSPLSHKSNEKIKKKKRKRKNKKKKKKKKQRKSSSQIRHTKTKHRRKKKTSAT